MVKKIILVAFFIGLGITGFLIRKHHKNSMYYEFVTRPSSSDMPIIDVKIDGEVFPIGIDLGSKLSFALNKEILTQLSKRENGIISWRDLKGNYYESRSYILPLISIDGMAMKDVVVHQENDTQLQKTALWDDGAKEMSIKKRVGKIGRPILESFNFLLDLGNNKIIACNELTKLSENGYDIEKMIKVPLEEGKGFIIRVDTDVGSIKCAIDTGATINLGRSVLFPKNQKMKGVHDLPAFSSSKCIIGNKDFGKTLFYLYDMTPELTEIDGCLGMDFLKTHILYIDHNEKVVYIGSLENQILEREISENISMKENTNKEGIEESILNFAGQEPNQFSLPERSALKEIITEERNTRGSQEERVVQYSARNKTGSVTYKLETTTRKDKFGKETGSVGAGIEVAW